MGGEGPRALVLDAGPLIAFDKQDEAARLLIKRSTERRVPIVVPAPVLAQVWRDGRRQALLARLIAAETTHVDTLDENMAKAVGGICARSGTSDIADASVVLSARVHRARVITADATDIRRIDPHLEIAEL